MHTGLNKRGCGEKWSRFHENISIRCSATKTPIIHLKAGSAVAGGEGAGW